jgi:hypothetical protein
MRLAWRICFVLMCTAVLLNGHVGAEGAGLLADHAHVCDGGVWPVPPDAAPAPSICFEDDCSCSTPTGSDWGISCSGGGTPAGFEAACAEYCGYYFCGVLGTYGNGCVCNPVRVDWFNPLSCSCGD